MKALMEDHEWISSARVAEAIVDLAGDDARELEVLVEAARVDWRDVLAWDADRRNGVQRPVMSEEHQRRLLAWATGSHEKLPPGVVDLVLTDAAHRGPELVKAVRAITGLGLGEVAAMIEELPIRLVAGTTRAKAEELRARIVAAGGMAELR